MMSLWAVTPFFLRRTYSRRPQMLDAATETPIASQRYPCLESPPGWVESQLSLAHASPHLLCRV